MAVPRLAIFLELLHLGLMDRALLGIMAVTALRLKTMFHQVAQCHACLFQQVFAGLTTQGDPADEAILGDIACVPRSRSFGTYVSYLDLVIGSVFI